MHIAEYIERCEVCIMKNIRIIVWKYIFEIYLCNCNMK